MTNVPSKLIKVSAVSTTVASVPHVIAAALYGVEVFLFNERRGQHTEMHYQSIADRPDLGRFLGLYPDYVRQLQYFREDISARGGSGPKGLELVNKFLTQEKFGIQLEPGGPNSIYSAAIGKFGGEYLTRGISRPFANDTAGFALGKEGNQIRFRSTQNGGMMVTIKLKNGDYLILSQDLEVDAQDIGLTASIPDGLDCATRMYDDHHQYSGIHCPMASFNLKPSLAFLIGVLGVLMGRKDGNDIVALEQLRIAQALLQVIGSLTEKGVIVEVAAAVGADRSQPPQVDPSSLYAFDPTLPLLIGLARPSSPEAHVGLILGPQFFKKPTSSL